MIEEFVKGGADMMPEVTQDNLYLLLPGKITAVVKMISSHWNVPYLKALSMFYQSKTYRNLEHEASKWWHLGPVALFEEFNTERKNGAKI